MASDNSYIYRRRKSSPLLHLLWGQCMNTMFYKKATGRKTDRQEPLYRCDLRFDMIRPQRPVRLWGPVQQQEGVATDRVVIRPDEIRVRLGTVAWIVKPTATVRGFHGAAGNAILPCFRARTAALEAGVGLRRGPHGAIGVTAAGRQRAFCGGPDGVVGMAALRASPPDDVAPRALEGNRIGLQLSQLLGNEIGSPRRVPAVEPDLQEARCSALLGSRRT